MEIFVPTDVGLSEEELQFYKVFLQGQFNRYVVGNFRYGKVNARKKYMDRIGHEYVAYKHTGNMEQLINIAVYCGLEAYAPQNKKFHFDNTVDSVTRK